MNSGLVEFGAAGELLAAINVRVVALVEGGLELVQLLLGESGAVTTASGRRARIVTRAVAAARPAAHLTTAHLMVVVANAHTPTAAHIQVVVLRVYGGMATDRMVHVTTVHVSVVVTRLVILKIVSGEQLSASV